MHWRRGWRTVKGKNRMEKQEARDNEHDQAARMHLVMLMQAGYPWHKAAATAGLHISRSTVRRRLLFAIKGVSRPILDMQKRRVA